MQASLLEDSLKERVEVLQTESTWRQTGQQVHSLLKLHYDLPGFAPKVVTACSASVCEYNVHASSVF